MGRKYATLSGEPAPVADAIFERLPRFTGDVVAKSPVGIAVSLADKLDTIVAVSAKAPNCLRVLKTRWALRINGGRIKLSWITS